MDFGFIYFRDRNADRAAMGLGCFVFIIFFFVPYILSYIAIPAFIILLLLCLLNKKSFDEIKKTLILPIAAVAASCVICVFFWWAIPMLINMLNDFKDIIFTNKDVLFREKIPDDLCYLYFIAIFGGGFSSFFSLTLIFSEIDDLYHSLDRLQCDNPEQRMVEYVNKYGNDYSFNKRIQEITSLYKSKKTTLEKANGMIGTAVMWRCRFLDISPQKDPEKYKEMYEQYKLT